MRPKLKQKVLKLVISVLVPQQCPPAGDIQQAGQGSPLFLYKTEISNHVTVCGKLRGQSQNYWAGEFLLWPQLFGFPAAPIQFSPKLSACCSPLFPLFEPGFCWACFTRILLPATSLPLSFFMAALDSPGPAISTNPKPFDPPVVLSVTNVHDCTVPYASNNKRSSFSVVVRARLRINSFMLLP